MRANRPVMAIALACLLLLAGCSGSGGQDMAATEAMGGGDGGDVAESRAEATGTPADRSGGAAAQDSTRKRIRTAELRVTVSEFEASRSNLSTAVASYGGYVSSSEIRTEERRNETYSDGTIVYRVPAENYSVFMEAVKAQGTVQAETEDVNDVTQRHADLEARLESLRAERDRLRELYEQANDTEDVLAVQRELADVQREIETTEARLRTLENKVAYSTITLHLHEERPEYTPPEQEKWYDTGVITAFLESVDGVVVTLRAIVVGLAYVLPYVVVLGLPAFGTVALVQRLRSGGGGPSLPFTGTGGGSAEDGDGDDQPESEE
ncbi:MAG: DUF4349 domain-containing protein [Halolamina sp.]|uniref:DUF4349 domain-containing protein n=1 Tax=Halolamina sp. TaxID=1940283 RepID=UPI002FC2FCF9